MKIVGVGCGPGLLTVQAIREIKQSRVIYGSARALDLVREYIPATCTTTIIEDYRNLSELPGHAVVLSTGDPMLAGLGYLSGEVVPGISSLQVAAARLRLPLARFVVVVAHGREHEKAMLDTIDELKRGKLIFLIADPKFDAGALYQRILQTGLSGTTRVAVCENLGYPEERIATGDLRAPPFPGSGLYSLVIGTF